MADYFNHAMRRNPRFYRVEQLLTVLGPIWKSAKDDVIAWLSTYGWSAQVKNPEVHKQGRPAPPHPGRNGVTEQIGIQSW